MGATSSAKVTVLVWVHDVMQKAKHQAIKNHLLYGLIDEIICKVYRWSTIIVAR